MNKVPSFFGFFQVGKKMEVPTAFTERMGNQFPENVFLRDRHNHLWRVKMTKVGNVWYFGEGWNTFVYDNVLTSWDLLVFSHIQENLFHVKLYGLCATEKNLARPCMNRSVETCMQSLEKKETYDDDDDEDYKDNEEDYDDEYDFDEITEPEIYGHLSFVFDNSDEDVRNPLNNDNNDGVVGNTGQEPLYLYPKWYGMEIFEAGLAEKPMNPYFVSQLMPKRRSNLFIPKDVIKDYNLSIGHEIILVDPSGREFLAKCTKWSDGRYMVAKGWVSLCRVNSVKENDKCICEFVQREGDQRQFLSISFVRNI